MLVTRNMVKITDVQSSVNYKYNYLVCLSHAFFNQISFSVPTLVFLLVDPYTFIIFWKKIPKKFQHLLFIRGYTFIKLEKFPKKLALKIGFTLRLLGYFQDYTFMIF